MINVISNIIGVGLNSDGKFNPNLIPNLIMDFDGNKGITVEDGKVVEWRDQNLGYVCNQNSEDSRPTLIKYELHGRDVISFDGINDFMIRVGNIDELINESELTIIMVSNQGTICYQNQNELTTRSIQLTQNNNTSNFNLRIAREGVNGNGQFTRTDGDDYTIKILRYNGGGNNNVERLEGWINDIKQTLTFNGTVGSTTFTTGNSKRLYFGAVEAGTPQIPRI